MVSPSDEWVLLAYRIPREPSTPRIAVWRKLKRLGAVQLLDGLVGLPHDARTKEQLEWIADEVVAAGGEADIWLGRPATKRQQRTLAGQMSSEVDAEYEGIADEAVSALGDAIGTQKRSLGRLRRELKRVGQRDHFGAKGRDRAVVAVERLAEVVERDEARAAR